MTYPTHATHTRYMQHAQHRTTQRTHSASETHAMQTISRAYGARTQYIHKNITYRTFTTRTTQSTVYTRHVLDTQRMQHTRSTYRDNTTPYIAQPHTALQRTHTSHGTHSSCNSYVTRHIQLIQLIRHTAHTAHAADTSHVRVVLQEPVLSIQLHQVHPLSVLIPYPRAIPGMQILLSQNVRKITTKTEKKIACRPYKSHRTYNTRMTRSTRHTHSTPGTYSIGPRATNDA